ncbi:MAG: hypothetical protein HY553_04470 [Elusimicrobia bacterium]|nr:hypothetical protein [Elusimicrobiota bacterium]
MTGGDIARVTGAVRTRLGIAPSAEQLPELARWLAQRLAALGCTAEEYCSRLAQPAELQALAARLTVPETSFYRFGSQWEALRAGVLPALLQRARAHRRRIRLWSAGCCTGEEAYTLAILVSELGCAPETEILATDVNDAYLELARAACYKPRAVRGLPPEWTERYFRRSKGQFFLDERVRALVRFGPLNLAEPTWPSAATRTLGVDLILCENVLIYFDPPGARRALARLRDALAEGGVLALGSSELVQSVEGLSPREIAGAYFLVKGAATPPKPAARVKEAPHPSPLPAKRGEARGADPLDRVGRLVEEGRAEDARALCAEWAAARPLDPRAHYWLGLIGYEDPAGAAEHFKRVLYLDPEHLLARLHLARCAQRLGKAREAAREFGVLGRLAARRDPDEVVDPQEGVTCGLLAALCRKQLQGGRDAMDHRH